jgi:hypothetical protein
MKGQLLSAMVESITTRKDHTLKVVIGTQDLNPTEAGQLFQYMNQLVSVYLCPAEINQKEIDQIDKLDPEFNGKTQSQRLRNTLFVWFSQGNQGFKDFDSFYKHHTERFIDEIKNLLQ